MSEVANVTTCIDEWDFKWIQIEDLEGILNEFKPQLYHPDDPRYNSFWQLTRSKCIEGIWYPQFGQYRYVPGRIGFYGNYCTIVETDKKTKARLKEHVVYARVLHDVDLLEDKYRVMDLSNPMMSDKDKMFIDKFVEHTHLNFFPHTFVEMCEEDQIGNLIRNTEFWVQDIFKDLLADQQ